MKLFEHIEKVKPAEKNTLMAMAEQNTAFFFVMHLKIATWAGLSNIYSWFYIHTSADCCVCLNALVLNTNLLMTFVCLSVKFPLMR